ncbi:FAD-dependent oxidoreductase [Microbacterium sp. B2969]|uniref:FAD-dependent oxidoreductase n=1 Tax=Microbacterium alkaliflavum TaxID=3248839 RepID=A0ABW7QE45_9MICO
MTSLHVLIAGGGIGGLCLAQGLRKAGISCAVYEATSAIAQTGYRLHMNALGGGALRECLPDNLYELYLQTSRRTPRREMFVVIDAQGRDLLTRPHIGPPNDSDRPHTAVNRRTLRQILATGLDDVLHFGRTAVGYEVDADGVRLMFEDGSSTTGDVLIGADGIHSRVRSQLLPDVGVIDTKMRGVWSTAPLTADLQAVLPEAVFDGFTVADRGDGTIFAVGVYDPRRSIAEAVAELAPGAAIDDVAPYVMVTFGTDLGAAVHAALPDFARASAPEMHEAMRRAMAGAHAGLVELVDRVDESTIAPNAVRYLEVADPWEPGRVTLLGDAIHAMPPSFGAGANSALRDAAALVRALRDVAEGKCALTDAIGEYEEEMRAEVFPIMRASADPDAVHSDAIPDVRR